MTLKEHIKLILAEVPVKTTVNFDIAIVIRKGELHVNTYGSNKIRFSVTKTEK